MMPSTYQFKQSFSLQLATGNKYSCNAVFPLVVTNFALNAGVHDTYTVHAEIGEESLTNVVCCTLSEKCPQYSTQLVFSSGETVTFTVTGT